MRIALFQPRHCSLIQDAISCKMQMKDMFVLLVCVCVCAILAQKEDGIILRIQIGQFFLFSSAGFFRSVLFSTNLVLPVSFLRYF